MINRTQRSARGFTLVELLIVISLISILAAMGLVQYKNSVVSTQESVLKTDLFRMRDAIDQYYADKGKYPSVARLAGQRRLLAQGPRGSHHEVGGHLADGSGRSPTPTTPARSPASTTSRAARKAPRSTDPTTRTGRPRPDVGRPVRGLGLAPHLQEHDVRGRGDDRLAQPSRPQPDHHYERVRDRL